MVARRARERAELRVRALSSTSTGRRSSASSRARCCCRFSAISTASCSSAAISRSSTPTARVHCQLLRSHLLPVDPRIVGNSPAPRARCARATSSVQTTRPGCEFLSILTALQHLPPSSSRDADAIAERHREKEVARSRLARTVETTPAIRAHVDRAVTAWNGTPGKPASFDRLHALLEAQNYRLSYWRTAAHEINYRRFFDVNELAGIRMEEPEVFEHAHALVLRLIADGIVTGLRLDHPDGLADPVAYVARLQARVAAMGFTGDATAAAPALHRGREDPVAGRIIAGRLGRPRDDDLPVPQPREQPVRRREPGLRHAPCLRAAHGPADLVRRADVPEQAAHHAHVDGERAQRARPCAERSVRERSAFARFHAERPAHGADRDRRVLPDLPHLRQSLAASATRDRDVIETAHRPRTPPQPRARSDHLRLPAQRAPAARARLAGSRARPDRARSAARLRDEAAAVHRAGARQGRRGHGVLPAQRAGLAERGRRRSGAVRAHRRTSSTPRIWPGSSAGRSR